MSQQTCRHYYNPSGPRRKAFENSGVEQGVLSSWKVGVEIMHNSIIGPNAGTCPVHPTLKAFRRVSN